MAINWTDAQIEQVVNAVIKELGTEKKVTDNDYCSRYFEGRKLIGIYDDMNDAISAAEAGYKAVRAMIVE